jgi:hypothetical protein
MRNACLVALSTALFLLVAEGALWLYDLAQGRPPAAAPVIRPFRIFGPALYAHDDQGRLQLRARHGERFAFEKPPGTVRIVVFGGSTSVNKRVHSSSGLHYPLELQRLLNARRSDQPVEVISVANEAYTSAHALIILALDVLSWQPDLVVLSHNFNDLTASYFPDFVPDYSHKFSHDYYMPGPSELLWKRSRLYRFIDARLRKLARYPVRRGSYGDAPPALGAAVFRRNLESFVTLAHANGVAVVLGSQPLARVSADEFDADLANKPYNRELVYPTHAQFLRHHAGFNAIIAAVARRHGALFVDNARAFGDERALFSDFLHYSHAGVERLADNYARAILAGGLLEQAAPAALSSLPQ